MMMTVWSVTVKTFRLTKSEDSAFDMIVCTKSSVPRDALTLARARYSARWWEDSSIIDLKEIGQLYAVEGMKVPEAELDW